MNRHITYGTITLDDDGLYRVDVYGGGKQLPVLLVMEPTGGDGTWQAEMRIDPRGGLGSKMARLSVDWIRSHSFIGIVQQRLQDAVDTLSDEMWETLTNYRNRSET